MTIAESKMALRKELRKRLGVYSAADRATASSAARELLKAQEVWQRSGKILFYSPMADEVDVWPLVAEAQAAGKHIALPRYVAETGGYQPFAVADPKNDLEEGRFGIPEPAQHCQPTAINQLDLVLVPGVGFDGVGRRLGRGKGFYDRLLPQVSGIKCGLAFDFQIVAEIPEEPHDVLLDCLLTPTRWHFVAGHRPVT
jgi:5-formyltetrahydrofolate cyclo-ligase